MTCIHALRTKFHSPLKFKCRLRSLGLLQTMKWARVSTVMDLARAEEILLWHLLKVIGHETYSSSISIIIIIVWVLSGCHVNFCFFINKVVSWDKQTYRIYLCFTLLRHLSVSSARKTIFLKNIRVYCVTLFSINKGSYSHQTDKICTRVEFVFIY